MAYTKQTWTTGDTVTASKMNHIEDGIAAVGSGGYDLIIETGSNVDMTNMQPGDLTIVKGNILDLEDKIDNGDPVSALFIGHWDFSYVPTGRNTSKVTVYMPLSFFSGPYLIMSFSALYKSTAQNNGPVFVVSTEIHYDPDDGSITAAYGAYKTIS